MRDQASESLIIDPSPPEPLTDGELRAWMGDQTVFVSSVMADMTAERQAVAAAVQELGGRAVLFERLGGRDDDAESAYLTGVRSSDIYVGILGERYGKPEPSGYSPTHAEYNAAVHAGLRISVWTTTEEQDGRQRDFLYEVRTFHTTGTYASPAELATRLQDRLQQMGAAACSPWCKVGRVLFRAKRYTDSGDKVTVEASLRDDAVIAALEALRPGQRGGSPSTQVTCVGRTSPVRIDTVTVEASAGRARHVRIEATKEDRQQATSLTDVSFEGRSPDDLTELALRVAMLGETNPLGPMSFFAEMPNPLAALGPRHLDEDSFSAAAGALLVEALVGSGRAERVTTVRIGPAHHGRRRVLVEWVGRRRYTNVEPEIRTIEGEVSA